ncbi:alpha/beta fold hydrolase [Actinoplanes sp. CA-054009]
MTVDIGGFTSEKAQDRFLRSYEEARRRLVPAELTPVDVPTSFGVTRVYATGGDGIPFVLLPGAGGNVLSWHAYLGAVRPVIAIDPVGEPGASVQDEPLRDGGDWARWLDETLTALKAGRVHLVGTSFGGWVAIEYALSHPGRVATVTVVDPAGFGRVTGRFIAWVTLGGLAAFMPRAVRRLAARVLQNATLLDDDLMTLLRASTGYRRRHVNPPPLTDDRLGRITVPVQALLGGRSQMYDGRAVAARIAERVPQARAEVVPGAGHDLAVRDAGLVIERVTGFASRAQARA